MSIYDDIDPRPGDWESKNLRAMAAYIRKNGFSPEYMMAGRAGCGCFIHARDVLCPSMPILRTKLEEIVGRFDVHALMAHGWDETATQDAAAACEIAADLVAP